MPWHLERESHNGTARCLVTSEARAKMRRGMPRPCLGPLAIRMSRAGSIWRRRSHRLVGVIQEPSPPWTAQERDLANAVPEDNGFKWRVVPT